MAKLNYSEMRNVRVRNRVGVSLLDSLVLCVNTFANKLILDYTKKSEEFVDEAFGGSLPAFLAAFTSRQKLSDKEIAEIRKIIDEAKE